jgi:hypothetical protein
MRRSIGIWCLRAFLVVIASSSGVAFAGSKDLANVQCMHILVEELGPGTTATGVNQAALADGLLVRMKARLARVDLSSKCYDMLYLNLTVDRVHNQNGQDRGYYGAVRLEVLRPAVLTATNEPTLVTVWVYSVPFVGSTASPQAHALEIVEELLDKLGADYYRAGNR